MVPARCNRWAQGSHPGPASPLPVGKQSEGLLQEIMSKFNCPGAHSPITTMSLPQSQQGRLPSAQEPAVPSQGPWTVSQPVLCGGCLQTHKEVAPGLTWVRAGTAGPLAL